MELAAELNLPENTIKVSFKLDFFYKKKLREKNVWEILILRKMKMYNNNNELKNVAAYYII